jgi:hypothetical protein
MKKLLVIFIVLAFVAPAFAADNLSLSGQVRLRSWDTENYSDFDDDLDDKSEYIEQRFRLQATIQANDQVKAVTRVDLSEGAWGSSAFDRWRYEDNPVDGTAGASSNSVIQVDRAYLDVTTGPVNIKAGQQFIAVGQSQVLRDNKPGIQVTIKTPVIIELGYSVDEDQDQGGTTDEQVSHISLEYAADTFKVQGFYATQVTSAGSAGVADTEDTKTVFGVNGKFDIGPVNINTELAMFGGDNGAATATDYMGTQFNVDADMKLSDMIKIGADLVYSDGTDGNSNETKIVYISDPFGILSRTEGGSGNNYWAGDVTPVGDGDAFDPGGYGQGAMGIGADVVITPMAGLDVLLHVMYLTAAEDTAGDTGYDNALIYNIGVTYALAPKAVVGLYYNATAAEFEDSTASDDTASLIGALLQIDF